MSERDAFGREKGEDSLAGMGWTSSMGSGPAPTAAAPTVSAGDLPPNGPAPAWTPPTHARRRRRGGGIGLLVALFVIIPIAVTIAGGIIAFNAGSDALDDITSTIESGSGNSSISRSRTKSAGTSLVGAGALKAALAQLPKGDITMLRVAPERIDAIVNVDGRQHAVQVTAGGDVQDITTPGGATGDPVKPNAAAPMRIARTAARRAGQPISQVNYLVLIHLLDKDEWQLFFKDGTHFSGSANGKHVRKVG
jgi:hypothetical protein